MVCVYIYVYGDDMYAPLISMEDEGVWKEYDRCKSIGVDDEDERAHSVGDGGLCLNGQPNGATLHYHHHHEWHHLQRLPPHLNLHHLPHLFSFWKTSTRPWWGLTGKQGSSKAERGGCSAGERR